MIEKVNKGKVITSRLTGIQQEPTAEVEAVSWNSQLKFFFTDEQPMANLQPWVPTAGVLNDGQNIDIHGKWFPFQLCLGT